jgi:GNAT superfamily N-acetyltransferase
VVAELAQHARLEALGTRGAAQWTQGQRGEQSPSAVGPELFDPHCGGVFVGSLDDAVVGYAVVNATDSAPGVKVARISELFVLPEARGVGVAEVLMDTILDWARAEGCDAIEASVLPGNRAGKNLFERYGLTARLIVVHRSLRTNVRTDRETPDAP